MQPSSSKLITIMLASIRPHNLSQLMFSLQDTLARPERVEVLVKIDDGDDAMREYIEMAQEQFTVPLRYLQSPREDGYYTLHHGYQQLYEMSDPGSYFYVIINDEVRFATKGWDTILEKYVGFYPDDVFRIKISMQKLRNYYSVYECGPCPENYPITTRRWMEITEGVGDCWGPDVWHQMIDYHLGMHSPPTGDYFRSVPVSEIVIKGEEAGQGLSQKTIEIRSRRIQQEWWRINSAFKQQEIRRLAVKLQAYLWAKNKEPGEFSILEDKKKRYFMVTTPGSAQPLNIFLYHLPCTKVMWNNFGLLCRQLSQVGDVYGAIFGYVVPGKESGNLLFKYSIRIIKSLVALFALLYAALGIRFYSCSRNHLLNVALWFNGFIYSLGFFSTFYFKNEDSTYKARHEVKMRYTSRQTLLLEKFGIGRTSANLNVVYSSDGNHAENRSGLA